MLGIYPHSTKLNAIQGTVIGTAQERLPWGQNLTMNGEAGRKENHHTHF